MMAAYALTVKVPSGIFLCDQGEHNEFVTATRK